jgi:hypothetical protein
MKRMTLEIRDTINRNLTEARECRMFKDSSRCWTLLEDAHVLSQPWAWVHVRVHGSMFVAAIVQRDIREIRGQVLRFLVGGPASVVGKYPIGNTGRARVPATQPMPICSHLAIMLEQAGQRTT